MTAAYEYLFPPSSRDRAIVLGSEGTPTRADLLRDAATLAARLPESGAFMNLCQGRYNFLVAFVAVLLRSRHCILPSDPGQAEMNALARDYADASLLIDRDSDYDQFDQFDRIAVDFDGTGQGGQHSIPRIPLDRPVATVFSSGSTGKPTPVNRTWGWMLAGARHYVSGLGLGGLDEAHIVATVPSQHSYGLETAIMLPLFHGMTVRDNVPFYPSDVATALRAAHRPRILVTTPFHLRVLLESEVVFPAVDVVVSATAPLPSTIARDAERRMKASVREVYGCTEIGLVATRRPTREAVWTLAEDLNLEITDTGPRIRAGHLPAPVPLADAIEPAADRRQFHLKGRSDDLIKIAGKRASLASLNQALAETDGVADGVFFMPPASAPKSEPRLMAFVVAPDRTDDQLRSDLRSRIAPPFLPRPIVRVAEIPRTPNGKVRYNDLIELSKGTGRLHE